MKKVTLWFASAMSQSSYSSCDSRRCGRAVPPERVRSRSPVARGDDDGLFSTVVSKKSKKSSAKSRKRAAQLEELRRLEEEAESLRMKAVKDREAKRVDVEAGPKGAEGANDRAGAQQGGRKKEAAGGQGLDRVKNGVKDVYVVCENIMSAPKKIKMEVHNRVVLAQSENRSACDSECVSEAVSVPQEMQQIASDLRGLLFSDANKVSRFVTDKILAQASKYELVINKVNLENERLRGRAEASERIYEKLRKVSDDVDLVNKNVCRVNGTCESLSARPVGAPSGAGQGHTPAGQPKSFAVIVRGVDKDLTTAEVSQRLHESVCPEVDMCVRSIRPVRGGGVVIETASDRDRKRLTGSSTFHEVGLRAAEPKRIDPRIVIYDVPCAITEHEHLGSLHAKNLRGVGSIEQFKRGTGVVRRWGREGARVSNVIVQLPLAYRDQLLRGGRVYVDWSSYKVSAWESVPRYLACMGFGHNVKEYRSERLCYRCARPGHLASTCKAPERCNNCHVRKLPSGHSAASRGCPEYVRRLEML